MRKILALLLPALVAPLLLVTSSAPATAATECQWVDRGELFAYKFCSGIDNYLVGSRVTDGVSYYEPLYTHSPSVTVNFRLSDTAADGDCTWIRVKKTDSPWPFNRVQPNSEVCGKGTHRDITVYFWEDDAQNMAPGLLEVQHCKPTLCDTFWQQRIS